ncbi:hypothetical protein GCM10007978_35740 [Shewanella hanedai]|uniref:DUF3319 domain-containing protein n=1 Tax=Shewanella hanedai TaxID=25 RepID=A0A553JJH0_SHEHA|nr:DUF3319 domain-containing protein [Shewanella hanedai]TRY12613.1 DUF3319 domain-containing protein [Shewanella hanedai]GGI94906.1 hypothetical protein GCM10007978_35740 [Shewanella hanedai]
MRKLIYQGYILTNAKGLTDTWTLTISGQCRTGSLFELRRQINFYCELGVLPPTKLNKQTGTKTNPAIERIPPRRYLIK